MSEKRILMLEPFYGGSHKQLIDLIYEIFPKITELVTMPAKKWHWRAITSPLYFAEKIPKNENFRVLFTSSVLPLAELVALRPDLANLYKIAYFHENQLIYPVQKKKDRYFQHGYNDVLTCLVADKVLFNTNFNKESFLSNISKYFNVMPDYKPKNLEECIRPKCEIAFFPIFIPNDYTLVLPSKAEFCETTTLIENSILKPDDEINLKMRTQQKKLHIVWPHRWEHDKEPDTFFSVLFRLKDSGEDFYLSVVGETFQEKPRVFEEAASYLKENILNWGYKTKKEEYFQVLESADVAVSTASHEFFGVSMLESVSFSCYPLCPKRLAYPEIYPEKYLYNTPNQLYKRLKYFCRHPHSARNHKIEVDLFKFSWDKLKIQYRRYLSKAID